MIQAARGAQNILPNNYHRARKYCTLSYFILSWLISLKRSFVLLGHGGVYGFVLSPPTPLPLKPILKTLPPPPPLPMQSLPGQLRPKRLPTQIYSCPNNRNARVTMERVYVMILWTKDGWYGIRLDHHKPSNVIVTMAIVVVMMLRWTEPELFEGSSLGSRVWSQLIHMGHTRHTPVSFSLSDVYNASARCSEIE